ncbi:uncharacterized protein LOC127749756 [Frankliniella occidentalis]|uniref:Uncharacterized protein LOC127749756 n=1 Tax=Frankliniella occidentalis TaxID=133901 RepID=A0A9C6U7Z4_FRAOC|nr:uncharacterized protein LOC127749756 [Frankliniella occidentalis]
MSLDRFCGTEIGASVSLIIGRLDIDHRHTTTKNREVATPIKLAGQSTPIRDSALNLSARSTSKWSVSHIESLSCERKGAFAPRKLYGDSETTDYQGELSSTHCSKVSCAKFLF